MRKLSDGERISSSSWWHIFLRPALKIAFEAFLALVTAKAQVGKLMACIFEIV